MMLRLAQGREGGKEQDDRERGQGATPQVRAPGARAQPRSGERQDEDERRRHQQ
jgi:hypothetical protein